MDTPVPPNEADTQAEHVKEIVTALNAVNSTLQELSGSEIEARRSAAKSTVYPPPVTQVELRVLHSQEYRKENRVAKDNIRDNFKLWVDILGFIVIFGYTTIAGFQLQQMTRATDASEKAANAASQASNTARDALEKAQRAFVAPTSTVDVRAVGEGPAQTFTFTFHWMNSGTTPTRMFRTHVSYSWNNKPMTHTFDFSDVWPPMVPHINTKAVIGPKAEVSVIAGPIPSQIIQEVIGHTFHLYFWGWAKYRDIFAATPAHVTQFCYEFIP